MLFSFFRDSVVLSYDRLTAGVTRWWAGRDHAVLTESASSHVNCLTARRACARSPYGLQSHQRSLSLSKGRVHYYPGDCAGGCVGRFTPRSNLPEAKTTFHQFLVKC